LDFSSGVLISQTSLLFCEERGILPLWRPLAKPGAAVFAYGAFIMAIINFLIIAFVVFMLVRYVNREKDASAKKDEAVVKVAPAGPSEIDLLTEIRDALKR
jgi:large conductance mechanosensitive channel protein